MDCVVYFSEFEDGEMGQVLPKCNHNFHINCIDMWFQSHSTYPLCTALVKPPLGGEIQPEVTVTEQGSSFEL
ncbi:Zinc finger, RING/FYVE/PHD-type [Sesbania bispinosa]|nr:Zinc finger, RING/FYVE/PHD-type [Sesbania bispinosa]